MNTPTQPEAQNILFLHIPKTGGQSIVSMFDLEDQFSRRNEGKYYNFRNNNSVCFGHADIQSLLKNGVISQQFYNESYKFCIVRNPYDRAVSLYHYLIQRGRFKHYYTFSTFIKYLDANFERVPPVGDYNVKFADDLNNQWNPMVSWIPSDIDAIYKFEEFEKIPTKVAKAVGLATPPSMVKRNPSKHHHFSSYYTLEARDIVQKLYHQDFEAFDYAF